MRMMPFLTLASLMCTPLSTTTHPPRIVDRPRPMPRRHSMNHRFKAGGDRRASRQQVPSDPCVRLSRRCGRDRRPKHIDRGHHHRASPYSMHAWRRQCIIVAIAFFLFFISAESYSREVCPTYTCQCIGPDVRPGRHHHQLHTRPVDFDLGLSFEFVDFECDQLFFLH